MDTKRCSKCLQEKPLDAFRPYAYKRRDGTHKIRSICHQCDLDRSNNAREKAYKIEWARRNPEKCAAYNKSQTAKRREAASFDERLTTQNGVCAICHQPETIRMLNGTLRPLSMDHDHTTKQWRGLLCGRCNAGLGMFMDDIPLMQAAIAYLEQWKTTPLLTD